MYSKKKQFFRKVVTTIFPILPFILIAVAIIAISIKRSNAKQQEEMDGFWERERKAALTRPVDLNTLPYLNIPLDKFYFGTINSPEIQELEAAITEISKKPLINLSGKTNTELKETYGSPNLEAMKAIGDDFDTLTMLLVSYAQALINEGAISQAITVLEYGVFIKSDISTNYTLLADCFIKLGQPRRINTLREQVVQLHLLMEHVILNHFDKLLSEDESQKDTPEDFNV